MSGIFPIGKIFFLQRLLRLLGLPGGENPVLISVTQVEGDVGRFTPVEPVINYLKHFNIKLGWEIPKLIDFTSSFASMFIFIILISYILSL